MLLLLQSGPLVDTFYGLEAALAERYAIEGELDHCGMATVFLPRT